MMSLSSPSIKICSLKIMLIMLDSLKCLKSIYTVSVIVVSHACLQVPCVMAENWVSVAMS